MLLPLDQRKVLLEVLTGMFSQLDDFRTFLINKTGRHLDMIAVGDLATVQSKVVVDAEEKEWLLELFEALHETAGAGMKAKLDSIGTIEEIREARFHDDCFVNQYPLVNRKDLRARLRTFTGGKGPRILHVRGTRFSGKSHTLLHIRHVADTLGIPRAEIELRKWATGEEIRPYDIGLTIAAAVPLSLPAHLDANASRWAVNFVNWIGPQLDVARKRLWIVFDDFETEKLKVPLPESLYDFIQLLAEKVAATPAMRLFLINYDKTLPSQVKPSIATDQIPAITEKDLGDFFFDFYATQVPDADLATAEQDAIVRARRVFAKMQTDTALRLESMRDALIDECTEILPGGGS